VNSRLQSLSFDIPVAVIGDIHGSSKLLRELLAALPAEMPVLVAGDLCDRGPDTRGVLDQLVARGARGVRGNHDEWFRNWAMGRGFDSYALNPMMGGQATLASYGIGSRSPDEIERRRWDVPASHCDFLENLPVGLDLTVMGQAYWVVHAGIASSEALNGLTNAEVVPYLAREKPATLLWPKTLPEDSLALDRTVIMGHVPLKRPFDDGFTIGLDTGAATCWPNRLTAVILPERRFITVG
jgi:serine/threonine protein phosphatase 1